MFSLLMQSIGKKGKLKLVVDGVILYLPLDPILTCPWTPI